LEIGSNYIINPFARSYSSKNHKPQCGHLANTTLNRTPKFGGITYIIMGDESTSDQLSAWITPPQPKEIIFFGFSGGLFLSRFADRH
jgi:hypothetical protein